MTPLAPIALVARQLIQPDALMHNLIASCPDLMLVAAQLLAHAAS